MFLHELGVVMGSFAEYAAAVGLIASLLYVFNEED
jgi:hypothetical protein